MQFDFNGFKKDDFNTVFENNVTGFKNIYGKNINLAQNTQDGQIIGIISLLQSDLQELLEYYYVQHDPDYAEGINQDRIAKLSGITRRPATKSSVDIEIVLNSDVILPADFMLIDTNNQKWIIAKSQTLARGTHKISFLSNDWGGITANANTINKTIDVYIEIDSVNNPLPAIAGQDEESDKELRIRRNKALEITSISTIGGLTSKLLNLANVADVIIYSNEESAYNSEYNLEPHQIWIIIKGGDLEDIGETIAINKTAGVSLKGDIEIKYNENFTTVQNTTKTIVHTLKIDRPIQINVFIKFNVSKRGSSIYIDYDDIKETITTIDLGIGENLTAISIYSLLNTYSNKLKISDIQMSRDNENWEYVEVVSGYNEELQISVENINISEI